MIIQGLPSSFATPDGDVLDLREVPESPLDPTDLAREQKRSAWRTWADAVRRYRIQRYDECLSNPEQQAVELQKCRRYGAAYFAVVWGWMYDPRLRAGRPIGPTPFIPYPFQIDLFRWFDERILAEGPSADGVISKSRDVGATWCACTWALHGYLFRDGFQARLVSRKEELVDRKNDMDSMFAKIDFLMDRLPMWMLPQGFERERHRLQLRLHNPSNGNGITGEATSSKTLRGGRATIAIYDEAAFIPNFLSVWATGANATDHRVAISSESLEEGDDFYRLRTGAGQEVRPSIYEIDWWVHPEHDDKWYSAMKQRFAADPEGFAREVERNPHAGAGAYIYEIAQNIVPEYNPYQRGQQLYVGIDPGFDDECALVFVSWDPLSGRYRVVEAYANRQQPPEFYASLLTGLPSSGVDGFDYRPTGAWDPFAVTTLMGQAHSFTIFGDPAGTNKVTGARDSWYDRMNRWAQEHTPMHTGLPVVVSWDMDKRTFQGRRSALMRLLPRLDFNDTPGVRSLLRSLQEYRFERSTRERMAEQVKPLHNSHSHPVAALEYIAVNLEHLNAVTKPVPGAYDAA